MFSLRAWNQQALTSFQNTCFESGVPLDVRRVHHNPTEERTDGVESLTEGQREALVTALRRGYFEVPRGHSQTEVAEELGISRQSFSRRLRRAQQNFEDFFWKDLVAAETV